MTQPTARELLRQGLRETLPEAGEQDIDALMERAESAGRELHAHMLAERVLSVHKRVLEDPNAYREWLEVSTPEVLVALANQVLGR